MDLTSKPSLTRQVLSHSIATPDLVVFYNMPLSLTMEKISKSTPPPKKKMQTLPSNSSSAKVSGLELCPGFCIKRGGQEAGCGGLYLWFQCLGSKGRRIRSTMPSLASLGPETWDLSQSINHSISQPTRTARASKGRLVLTTSNTAWTHRSR